LLGLVFSFLLSCSYMLHLHQFDVYYYYRAYTSPSQDTPISLVFGRSFVNTETDMGVQCQRYPNKCIHVVVAATGPYLIPMLACIKSIETNTHENVFIHVITQSGELNRFTKGVSAATTKIPIEIVEFNDAKIRGLIRVWDGRKAEVYYNTFNYARYYLPSMFPSISQMIYLDPDTIVLGDLGELDSAFRKRNSSNYFWAVPPKGRLDVYSLYCFLVNCEDFEIGMLIQNKTTSSFFNAGVFVTDLQRWREDNVTERLEYWLRRNTQTRLWRWGSQAALALVFYGRWDPLGQEWNSRRITKTLHKKEMKLSDAKIIHFTGQRKPWTWSGRVYWRIWCPYYVVAANARFLCKHNGNGNMLKRLLTPDSPYDYYFIKDLSVYDYQ